MVQLCSYSGEKIPVAGKVEVTFLLQESGS